MNCMKCGVPVLSDTAECPACGVILAKAKPPARPPAIPSAVPPPAATVSSPPQALPLPPLHFAGDDAATPQYVSQVTMAALRSARPWLRLVVIYGYVMTAIMILAAIGLLIYSFWNPRTFIIGFVYVLYGVLSLLLLTPLQQSSRALRTMTVGNVNASLEHFAQAQCRFWRMAGILSAITLALLAVVFAAAVLVGLLALARPGRP